jgi:hypothetical protein
MNKIVTLCDLCSHGIEALCRRLLLCSAGDQLPFANGVHECNASDHDDCIIEVFEPEHRSHSLFDSAVVRYWGSTEQNTGLRRIGFLQLLNKTMSFLLGV